MRMSGNNYDFSDKRNENITEYRKYIELEAETT